MFKQSTEYFPFQKLYPIAVKQASVAHASKNCTQSTLRLLSFALHVFKLVTAILIWGLEALIKEIQ